MAAQDNDSPEIETENESTEADIDSLAEHAAVVPCKEGDQTEALPQNAATAGDEDGYQAEALREDAAIAGECKHQVEALCEDGVIASDEDGHQAEALTEDAAKTCDEDRDQAVEINPAQEEQEEEESQRARTESMGEAPSEADQSLQLQAAGVSGDTDRQNVETLEDAESETVCNVAKTEQEIDVQLALSGDAAEGDSPAEEDLDLIDQDEASANSELPVPSDHGGDPSGGVILPPGGQEQQRNGEVYIVDGDGGEVVSTESPEADAYTYEPECDQLPSEDADQAVGTPDSSPEGAVGGLMCSAEGNTDPESTPEDTNGEAESPTEDAHESAPESATGDTESSPEGALSKSGSAPEGLGDSVGSSPEDCPRTEIGQAEQDAESNSVLASASDRNPDNANLQHANIHSSESGGASSSHVLNNVDIAVQDISRHSSPDFPQNTPSQSSNSSPSYLGSCASSNQGTPRKSGRNRSDVNDEQLLSELDAELERTQTLVVSPANGLVRNVTLEDFPEYKELKATLVKLQTEVEDKDNSIQSLQNQTEDLTQQLSRVTAERNAIQQARETTGSQADDIYLAQIKEMEVTIATQQRELKQTKERLSSHDAAAKRAVTTLQNELKTRVDQVTKMYEDSVREKDSMVMKYASGEQKNLELNGKITRLEKQIKELNKEKEIIIGKFRSLKAEKDKIGQVLETKGGEASKLRQDLEKAKEAVSSHEVKTKWAQNKLRAELEAHKETKVKLTDCQRMLKEAREETMQIRKDCQAMIKTYQESEEIKSNSLDHQLKLKENELLQQKQEKVDQQEVYTMMRGEMEKLKRQQREMIEELKTWKDKCKCLDEERLNQERHLEKYRETLQCQKKDNKELKARLEQLETVEQDLVQQRELAESLKKKVEELETLNTDLQHDMEGCAKRESEHLVFSQKISDKNAHLQSENTSLNNKVTSFTNELSVLKEEFQQLSKCTGALQKELNEEKKLRQQENESLTTKLADKTKAVEELTLKVEEEMDEKKTLKRKHGANIKDLTRQLQQARRKLETYEKTNDKDGHSMGSRTSSTGSLENMTNHSANHSGSNSAPPSRAGSQEPTPQEEYAPIVEVVEVDKNMLLEKIVRLQKAHARKNEKLEFMEDHIRQLVEEVQKKARIIQSYVLREESGTLAPESMDVNKAQLAKKGGIMASLYNSQALDGTMTLELSLDINRKLQSVLEDTLLKNITLKENLETLGEEIARLSQENRRLQLIIQKFKS